jgi:outer membrane autotransporter protein
MGIMQKMAQHRVRWLIFTILFSHLTLASAEDWLGNNANWFDTTNWNPAGLPDLTTPVTIDGGATSPDISAGSAAASTLSIGQNNAGTLNIDGTGSLQTTSTILGENVGGSGTAILTGPTSVWNNRTGMIVGGRGTGTLLVLGGGILNSGKVEIGELAGSVGTVVMSDAGSAWNVSGDLLVGEQGTGALILSTGATVSNVNGAVGSEGVDASGSISIDGAGTRWTNKNNLLIAGNGGSGTLDIENSGLVTDVNATVGDGSGSIGTVNVNGTGSTWSTTQNLVLGNGGTATLTVSNGSVVNAGREIVIGALGKLNIGAADGNAAAPAGSVQTPTVFINSGGQIFFNLTDSSYTFGANISGGGAVSLEGTGTTILSGNNSYTGGTTVNGGILQGTTSGLQGAIVNNSHVVFDQTFNGTFNGNISGTGDVTKSNSGRIIFSGTNTYTGNTIIQSGIVQIHGDDNLGLAGNPVVFATDPANAKANRALSTDSSMTVNRNLQLNDSGGLEALGTGTVFTFNGTITGGGNFIKSGNGVVLLTQPVANTGSSIISQGTLRAGAVDIFVTSPQLPIASKAVFDMDGNSQTIVDLSNNGLVMLGSPTYDTLTITGALTGRGAFEISTDLANKQGDLIQVTGTSSGTHALQITNNSQGVDPAPNTVLKVVQTRDGRAIFTGSVDAGTYLFDVERGGSLPGLPNDPAAWYLIKDPENLLTDTANAAIGLYSANLFLFYADLQTLTQRMGELRLGNANGYWLKPYGNQMQIDNQASRVFDQNTAGLQGGVDHKISGVWGGTLNVGAFGNYLNAQQDFHGGNGKTQAMSLGIYTTWLRPEGWYVDAVAKYTEFWNNFHTSLPSSANYKVPAFGGSVETGKRINFIYARNNYFVEPQGEIAGAWIDGMHYLASNGLAVAGVNQTSVNARLGVRSGMHFDIARGAVEPYVAAGVIEEFLGRNDITTNSTIFVTQLPRTVGRIGAGVTANITQAAYLYGEYNYAAGNGFREPVAVDVGLRITW